MTMTGLRIATMLAALAFAAPVAADGAVGTTATIVGWWSNPTPNNAYLLTGRTEYVVSEQGGTTADGDWPEFSHARYVQTNGASYGYGCATMHVVIDGKRVVRIVSTASLPLKRCRTSAALKKAEPSIK